MQAQSTQQQAKTIDIEAMEDPEDDKGEKLQRNDAAEINAKLEALSRQRRQRHMSNLD